MIRDMGRNIDSLYKIITAYTFNKKYPLNVVFIITYCCNFKCKYCSVWSYKEKEMTTEQIFSMIDEFTGMGMRRISFNGGEPLLRNDIKELIDYAKKKDLIVSLVTNGFLVKEYINKIKNLDVLVVSLDGPEKIHDKQRQKGSYKNVIKAIKTAKKANITVWTNTVITKNNLDHIDFLIEKAKELEFQMAFQPVLYYPHSAKIENIKKLYMETEKYKDTLKKLIQRKKEGAPIIDSITYLKYIMEPNWATNKRKCWAGRLYCTVLPNGEVAPCYPIFKNRKWSNGLELGFKKAFLNIPKFTCSGCYCSSSAESDFLFSFKPEVIYHTIKYYIK